VCLRISEGRLWVQVPLPTGSGRVHQGHSRKGADNQQNNQEAQANPKSEAVVKRCIHGVVLAGSTPQSTVAPSASSRSFVDDRKLRRRSVEPH
jgi:hypothetical protein